MGSVLLVAAAGALTGVAFAGRVSVHLGSHRAAIACTASACAFLDVVGLTGSLFGLLVGLFGFGASSGVLDVAMNANGVAVEKLYGRPIMSSLHGMFSLGGVSFAAVGWAVLRLGVSMPVHFVGATLGFLLVLVCVAKKMLPSFVDASAVTSAFAMPDPRIWAIGCIGFCAFLCEGAMGDWSAVYLRNVEHLSASAATYGYFAFTLSMTLTRFAGDKILGRWGPALTLRVCGLLTALGMGTALWIGTPQLAVVGFASVGLGMATVAPVAFGLGGKVGGRNPDQAIASVATVSYTAFLLGPAAIGFLASATSLRAALAVIVVLSIGISLLAGVASREAHVEV